MTTQWTRTARLVTVFAITMASAATADALSPESKRLARAKDYIAEEQWARAVDELRLAVADPKETRRDEALYWLAHSLNQSGDQAASVETISRLERDFPSSMWVKPAQSLRIEIAVRLNRSDVLWWTALPPRPAFAPRPVKGRPAGSPPAPASAGHAPSAPAAPEKLPAPPPPPPKIWAPDSYAPDADLQIQALGGLMKSDPDKVIPILERIAFGSESPKQAGRALFMLAESGRPEARDTVLRVAKEGPEPVRVVAVKTLGRFQGPEISGELLQVYATANELVKLQVVRSLGERAEKGALLRIAQSEKDGRVRYIAFECLGQAGEVEHLAKMYKSASRPGKRSIIVGLFIARADGSLILIADAESRAGDQELRANVLERLRVLGTPRAKEYLQKVSEKR